MSKICIINGKAPRYREAIFKKIDDHFDCDWYFGQAKTDIKYLDLSIFKRVKSFGYTYFGSSFYWKKNTISKLFNKEYNTFLVSIESRAISDYVFLLLKSLFFPKKRVYAWTHGWYGKETKFEAALKKWQFRKLTGIFTYGNYARKLLIQEGFAPDKVHAIHNSLHYDQQIELRKSIQPSDVYVSHFSNNNPVIIFIGRLTKMKQLDMLVYAVADLKAKNELYNLVFVGDGEERTALETLVTERGVSDQVWFYGACYDEKQNAELIYNADVCVAPGNVGLTAMHTMVFGTPVISHNDFKWQMPEFEAIHPGETGDFFERNNQESLNTVISCWLKSKLRCRDDVRKSCFNEIDELWNPQFQLNVLKEFLEV